MVGGKCNCGQVRFELSVSPSEVYICHCSICRRATGSNGIAVILVANEDFAWTSGEDLIASWKKPDADWQLWFCPVCASPLPGRNDDQRMFIPAGTLDDDAKHLHVGHHIWVNSKTSWDVIGDSGKQHPESIT